jgi:hypothetical protein
VLVVFALVACGGVESRISGTSKKAVSAGFIVSTLPTSPFPLYSAQRLSQGGSSMHIVIEGDGFAWVDRFHASNNPTPLDPVGLKIAEELSGDVVYLGRPCQYVSSPACNPHYWTDKRFAPEVLEAFNAALDQLKTGYGDMRFSLTGFSGGAYIAMRLAAMRSDVAAVNTAAGLLDPDAWTAYHKLSPIAGVPADTPVNANVRYKHFCGGEDDIIPCALTRRYVAAHPYHTMIIIKDADHGDIWKSLAGRL